MAEVVIVTENGSLIKGTYDGYGRVDSPSSTETDVSELMLSGRGDAYHDACWRADGKPTEWSKEPMRYSRDQGWFFDDADYEKVEKPAPAVKVA